MLVAARVVRLVADRLDAAVRAGPAGGVHDLLGRVAVGDADGHGAEPLGQGQTIAHMSEQTRTVLGQQGAAADRRKRTGGDAPRTRAELYELARQRDLPGRTRMGRDELARALGED